MKKTLFFCGAILIGLFMLLSFLDKTSEYAAEKSIWKINQYFAEVTKDPKSTPKATFADVSKQYEDFVLKFPDTKLTLPAYILAGRAYIFQENYGLAREKFEHVISHTGDHSYLAVQALVEIGRTYAIEGRDTDILRNYKRVIKEYPLTSIGLETPILLAKFHADRKRYVESKRGFENAVIYYTKLLPSHEGTVIGLAILRLKATSYLALNKYQDAINVFEIMLNDYLTQEFMNVTSADKLIKTLNTVATSKLKDYDIPIGIYQRFIKSHPNHFFNEVFEEMIRNFKMLKEQNVNVEFR